MCLLSTTTRTHLLSTTARRTQMNFLFLSHSRFIINRIPKPIKIVWHYWDNHFYASQQSRTFHYPYQRGEYALTFNYTPHYIDVGYNQGAQLWFGPIYYTTHIGRGFHRDGGPARIFKSEKQEYYQNGKLHREDGPAVIDKVNNEFIWYYLDKIHRDDGPAIISKYQELWYQFGVLHREDGPAMTKSSGETRYYQHGKLHREGGPAVERPDGQKLYYQNGKLHREDGPAVICAIYIPRWVKNYYYTTHYMRSTRYIKYFYEPIAKVNGKYIRIVRTNNCMEYWLNGTQVPAF